MVKNRGQACFAVPSVAAVVLGKVTLAAVSSFSHVSYSHPSKVESI